MKVVVSSPPGQFADSFGEIKATISAAISSAFSEAGDKLKTMGRANIASAGFGQRWQNAWRVNLYPTSKQSLSPALFGYHRIPYADVFEAGAIIRGSPKLWLPLDSAPNGLNGRKLTPRQFLARGGELDYVNRSGKPPLLVGKTVSERFSLGHRSIPMYVGIDQVKISKRFDLAGVADRVADQIPDLYYKNLKD